MLKKSQSIYYKSEVASWIKSINLICIVFQILNTPILYPFKGLSNKIVQYVQLYLFQLGRNPFWEDGKSLHQ